MSRPGSSAASPLKALLDTELGKFGVVAQALVREPCAVPATPQLRIDCGGRDAKRGGNIFGAQACLNHLLDFLPLLIRAESVVCQCVHLLTGIKKLSYTTNLLVCNSIIGAALAESVTLDQTTMELTVNGTGKLTATVKPDETTVKTIQWSSSDETVATVGADGTVTALKEGTAVITAKCGEKSAECTVTVKAEAVVPASITMEPTTLSLTVGQTHALIATVLPENATDKTVTWSSDAPSIVDVAADGTVTAKAVGTVTVTARAANGLAVTCIVTVTVAGE